MKENLKKSMPGAVKADEKGVSMKEQCKDGRIKLSCFYTMTVSKSGYFTF